MLYDYLFNLNIMDEAVLLKGDLLRLQDNLVLLKGFIEKELRKEDFSNRELQSIHNFLFEYDLVEEGNKLQKTALGTDKRKNWKTIDGLKMMIYVREVNGSNIFVLGPVYNYQEH
jgi:hypothetical protein